MYPWTQWLMHVIVNVSTCRADTNSVQVRVRGLRYICVPNKRILIWCSLRMTSFPSLPLSFFLSIPPSRRLHENQIMLQLCELYKMHACFLVQPPSPSPSRDPSILDDGGNNLRGDFFFCPAWGGCKMQEGKIKPKKNSGHKYESRLWYLIRKFKFILKSKHEKALVGAVTA